MRATLAVTTIFATMISFSGAAAAQSRKLPPYLALGDSIAFGFSPLIADNAQNVAAGDFVGYPETTAADAGFAVSNAACPGETSGSFLDMRQPDNGCHSSPYYVRSLKVPYHSSQLDYARAYLWAHPETELVTIDIGGNDLLLVQTACASSFIPSLCEVAELPGALVKFGANLTAIFAGLREIGYFGQIVAVTQYATNYADSTQTLALGGLKDETATIAALFGVTVADGYGAFQKAATPFGGDVCKAGLIIALPDGTCNEHPSPAGRQVLANAVLSVLN
jgi:lysophospholipase L1-like esterase